jgi:hypothetical protein
VNVCHLQFTLRVRLHILTYVPSRSAGPPAHPLTHDRTANPQSQTARAHSSSLSQRVSDAFTLPPGRPCGMGPWRARLTSADPYRQIGRFPSPRRFFLLHVATSRKSPRAARLRSLTVALPKFLALRIPVYTRSTSSHRAPAPGNPMSMPRNITSFASPSAIIWAIFSLSNFGHVRIL